MRVLVFSAQPRSLPRMDVHGPRSGWMIPTEHLLLASSCPLPWPLALLLHPCLCALASAHSVLHPGQPGLHS